MATRKEAGIKLIADIKGFKQVIDEAKKLLTDIGKAKLDPKFATELKREIRTGIAGSVKKLKIELKGVQKQLDETFDPKKALAFRKQIVALSASYSDLKKTHRSFVTGAAPRRAGDPAAAATAAGMTGGGGGTTILGGIGLRTLLPATAAAAAVAIYRSQLGISEQRLGIRALTGGAVDESVSALGFTRQERRQRQFEIAKELGRNVSPQDLRSFVDVGEVAERAFGVDAQTQAGLVGVARRGGEVGNENRIFAKSIGIAVTSGLEGSRISEFLRGMTDSLNQIREKGLIFSTEALGELAGAFSDLPLFNQDPQRSFRILQGLDTAFSSGTRLQQAQAARAMISVGGQELATPAAMEIRRSLGLFAMGGKQGGAVIESLRGAKTQGAEDLATFLEQTTPRALIKQQFQDVTDTTRNLDERRQYIEFATRLNMPMAESIIMFNKIKAAKGETTFLSEKDMARFKDAQIDPTVRLDQTFKGVDSSIKNLSSTLDRFREAFVISVSKLIAGETINSTELLKRTGVKVPPVLPLPIPEGARNLEGVIGPLPGIPTTPEQRRIPADIEASFAPMKTSLDKNTAALEERTKREGVSPVTGPMGPTGTSIMEHMNIGVYE